VKVKMLLSKAPKPKHQSPGKHQTPITSTANSVALDWCLMIGVSLEFGVWWLLLTEASPLQLGREQLVDLIERCDYFASRNKLLEIVATGQLFVFQKQLPEIRRDAL